MPATPTHLPPRPAPASDGRLTAIAFGGLDAALRLLERRVRHEPDQPHAWTSLGVAQARAGRFEAALSALAQALRIAPGHVLATAYTGICLHLLGRHDEAGELLDYEGMVDVAPLQGDADAARTQAFNAQLVDHVLQHPTLTWELRDKAIRGGYQTGELLTGDAPPVVRRLEQRLCAHLDRLLGTSDRPAPGWRLTAWAVSLHRGGRQLPHVHPRGLLSGVYYAQMPPPEPASDAGALRFHRQLPWLPAPSDATVSAAPGPRVVHPRAGTVVVFPSYFWHDTVPFASDTARISVAFDVLPPPQEP